MGAQGLISSAAGGRQGSDFILLAGDSGVWDGKCAPSRTPGPCCWAGEGLSICCREEASESNSVASSAGYSALGLSASNGNAVLGVFVQSNNEKQVWKKG